MNAWNIPIHGKTVRAAVVDAIDYLKLKDHKWFAQPKRSGGFYAFRYVYENGKRTYFMMHREIMGFPEGLQVDHINGNGIDNRRSNLRVATAQQNAANSKRRPGRTSKGAHYLKKQDRWRSCICVNGHSIHLGTFLTEAEAAKAYDDAAVKHFGEFAQINADGAQHFRHCGQGPTGYEEAVADVDPFAEGGN